MSGRAAPAEHCLPGRCAGGSAGDELHRAVPVAVIAARVVQGAVDQVVDMVAVGDGLVTATGTVPVSRAAAGCGRVDAAFGVGGTDVQPVLVVMRDLAVDDVRMMQMAVMEIVHVTVVLDRGVTAVSAVLVLVIWMAVTGVHEY